MNPWTLELDRGDRRHTRIVHSKENARTTYGDMYSLSPMAHGFHAAPS